MKFSLRKLTDSLYYVIPALCFTPFFSSPLALGAGIGLAFFDSSKRERKSNMITSRLLQASIVLMGLGMNLSRVIATSRISFPFTALSVSLTILCGLMLGRFFKVDSETALLISGGTAICGGSAIAALSSVINPRSYKISFSLTVVFVLNAVGLFIFPYIGHLIGLSQGSFGLWSAIAIHDTSSVVGAASAYGNRALEIATTVKLTRALWIIPVSLATAFYYKGKGKSRVSVPWFIGFFVAAIFLRHFVPGWETTYSHLSWLGKKGMLVALFFIGSTLNRKDIIKAGLKPFILGVILWIIISVASFFVLT